jgi:hypothetical protein
MKLKLVVIFAMALAPVAACGGGSGPNLDEDCHSMCQRASALGCGTLAGCVATCEAGATTIPPDCVAAYEGLIHCGATQGSVTCTSSGENIGGCDAQATAVQACVNGPGGGCSWTGTWSTDMDGIMTLTQTGDSVSGSYSSPAGDYSGTVSGNTVTGTWTQATSAGACTYGPQIQTMSPDCKSFTGTWYYCDASGSAHTIHGTRQ